MPQYNIFGELEQDARPEPEIIEEVPEPVVIPKKTKKRKSFEIGKCRSCGQLLLDDPENDKIKLDEELCEMCDNKLRAKYDQYRNFALIKALRVHKYLKY
jgi:hypothetical protein